MPFLASLFRLVTKLPRNSTIKRKDKILKEKKNSKNWKECPSCSEFIKSDALVCYHCNEEFYSKEDYEIVKSWEKDQNRMKQQKNKTSKTKNKSNRKIKKVKTIKKNYNENLSVEQQSKNATRRVDNYIDKLVSETNEKLE